MAEVDCEKETEDNASVVDSGVTNLHPLSQSETPMAFETAALLAWTLIAVCVAALVPVRVVVPALEALPLLLLDAMCDHLDAAIAVDGANPDRVCVAVVLGVEFAFFACCNRVKTLCANTNLKLRLTLSLL
jgi:hypothetical protein